MRLTLSLRTECRPDAGFGGGGLRRLRLIPRASPLQNVVSWGVTMQGGREEVRFTDSFGNETVLISLEPSADAAVIEAAGEVETADKAGVLGEHRGHAPVWLFLKETALTPRDDRAEQLARVLAPGSELARLHELMRLVAERAGAPDAEAAGPGVAGAAEPSMPAGDEAAPSRAGETKPEEDAGLETGGADERTHLFIAAARLIGLPARFVAGLAVRSPATGEAASHAWAEAHVPMLGWVAFDAVNCISPDQRYLRLAVGRDRRDTLAISGPGQAEPRLAVSAAVAQ